MTVPHDFLIQLVRQSKILEMVCEKLEIAIYDETGKTILERINTLQTVYNLHEESYEKKIQAVSPGESNQVTTTE